MSSPDAIDTVPEAQPPLGLDAGTADLLTLIRTHGALTRTQMNELTGWARVTVTARLEQLLQGGLVVGDARVAGARGRPATRYQLDVSRAMLLVADIGASGMRLARVDLGGGIEATRSRKVAIGEGPDVVLGLAREALTELAAEVPGRPVWGVALSLPGPVEFGAGVVVNPPIMTGWDGVPVRDLVSGWFDTPVLVDNDVNAMAVGEWTVGGGRRDLLVVKVGTGVGCGIVSGGRVLRGASGAAGDIGHTWADAEGSGPRPLCRCGKTGCVEAYVGGWALARDLGEVLGRDITVDTFVEHVASGDPAAVALVRDAGLVLGASIASAVSLLNPGAVVLGGQVVSAAGDHLLAGVRERVYSRALPLATRDLPLTVSSLWPDAGIHGLAAGIAEVVLSGRVPSELGRIQR